MRSTPASHSVNPVRRHPHGTLCAECAVLCVRTLTRPAGRPVDSAQKMTWQVLGLLTRKGGELGVTPVV